jgi:hypothetical protein
VDPPSPLPFVNDDHKAPFLLEPRGSRDRNQVKDSSETVSPQPNERAFSKPIGGLRNVAMAVFVTHQGEHADEQIEGTLKEHIMLNVLKKSAMAGLAAVTIAGASIAASSPAQARWGHGGGWVGPAIVGGLALGALAAAPRYGYGPSYAYGPGYYGCPRRVVGYTSWGRPIVRRVCY